MAVLVMDGKVIPLLGVGFISKPGGVLLELELVDGDPVTLELDRREVIELADTACIP